MNALILSLFPGIGLLDRAFEEAGFCVVRGPDVLWGGDIHRFHPPAGQFAGVIGGPPCQMFSSLAGINRARGRTPRFGNLIPEFERVVSEAQPMWFLMENVARAPRPEIAGYITRSLRLDNRWLGAEQHRERIFSFGTAAGIALIVDVALFEHPNFEWAVTSNGGGSGGLLHDRNGTKRTPEWIAKAQAARTRPMARLCELQGLPADFLTEAPFTSDGKKAAIANGVPLPMGRAIAQAVKAALMDQEKGAAGA